MREHGSIAMSPTARTASCVVSLHPPPSALCTTAPRLHDSLHAPQPLHPNTR